MRPTTFRLADCQGWATMANPAMANAIPAHTDPRRRAPRAMRIHKAMNVGARLTRTIATPTGISATATKNKS